MKEKGICKCCGNERVIFYNGMCQKCYKSSLDKREIDLKKEYKNCYIPKTAKEILNMFLQQGIERKEIAKKLGISYVYVCQTITKYTERK